MTIDLSKLAALLRMREAAHEVAAFAPVRLVADRMIAAASGGTAAWVATASAGTPR